MDTAMKKRLKKIIAAVVVIAVVLTGIFVINAKKVDITYRILYSIFPDHIDTTINEDVPITLYKRLNADYDSKKDSQINFMEFYYYDDEGNEVVVAADETLVYDGEDNGSAFIGFILVSTDKINKVISIAKIVGVVIALAVIAALIVFWFFKWSKKQDEQKEAKYGNSKKKKSKKKK